MEGGMVGKCEEGQNHQALFGQGMLGRSGELCVVFFLGGEQPLMEPGQGQKGSWGCVGRPIYTPPACSGSLHFLLHKMGHVPGLV